MGARTESEGGHSLPSCSTESPQPLPGGRERVSAHWAGHATAGFLNGCCPGCPQRVSCRPAAPGPRVSQARGLRLLPRGPCHFPPVPVTVSAAEAPPRGLGPGCDHWGHRAMTCWSTGLGAPMRSLPAGSVRGTPEDMASQAGVGLATKGAATEGTAPKGTAQDPLLSVSILPPAPKPHGPPGECGSVNRRPRELGPHCLL